MCFRFVGGQLNMCYNAVDRHVESGRGDQPAIIYDSPVTGTKQIITYRELQEQVTPLLSGFHIIYQTLQLNQPHVQLVGQDHVVNMNFGA